MRTSCVGAWHVRASHAVRSSRSQHLICMKSTKGDLFAIAGGLGLAAVQLAKAAGADVLATAGSVQKRMHLREQGVQNVVSLQNAAVCGALWLQRERSALHCS